MKLCRGERGKMGQKNIFAHYEKNIHVTQKIFILHCRACFILLCKIFPWLWVSYFTRYTIFKNNKIFQKSEKMGGKMGQIVSQMGQVEFHEEQQ